MTSITDFVKSPAFTRFLWNVLYFALGYIATQLLSVSTWWAIPLGALLNGISKEIANHIKEKPTTF